MNKQALASVLMQMAPQVLSALKGAYTMPDERAVLENAVQNGADPGLMGEQFNEIAAKRKRLTDGWDTPMSDTMNVNDLVNLYDTSAQAFPSQNATVREYFTEALAHADDADAQQRLSQALASPYADDPAYNRLAFTEALYDSVAGDASDVVPAGYDGRKGFRPGNKYRAAESADVMLNALWDAAEK